jgi:hypothetical protein
MGLSNQKSMHKFINKSNVWTHEKYEKYYEVASCHNDQQNIVL